MTPDEVGAQLSENSSGMRRGAPPDYVIEWKKIATVFNHNLLVATLVYAYSDAGGRTRKATLVLAKIIEECVEDPFSRFVFWLTADLNIESTRLGAETRHAIRAELAKTITPPTESQVQDMNMRMNSLPDYVRVFYLEDYFESMIKNKKESH
ncbi:MAG: hypothetical protein ABSB81_10555 [Halobacteriota archaeon]|jgi:hypothetical protein